MKSYWESPHLIPELAAGEIHIWLLHWLDFRSKLSYFISFLNDEERSRAERFIFLKDRERSIIIRGVLRILLGRYTNIKLDDLTFISNDYGKPKLKDSVISFNVSDSCGLVLLAFVRNFHIGVDLEQIRANIEFEDIAARFFSPAEFDLLLSLPKEQRLRAFFNCWTRKEAFIKALGLGLSYGLDKFDVDMVREGDSLLLAVRDDFKHEDCLLASLDMGEKDYVGAYSVIGSKKPLLLNLLKLSADFIGEKIC